MKEDLLHYAWQMQAFDMQQLATTEGQAIQILSFGHHNSHAGPDFSEARIRIGDTLWAGNVEMHLKSSDWWRHGHQQDGAYDNVILHVVLDDDEPVRRPNGVAVPCLELKTRIPERLAANYQRLLQNKHWIACQQQLPNVSEMTRSLWLDRLMVERLEQKTLPIRACLERNQHNWEESFYQLLARSFGLHINALPFEMLARSIPLTTLLKHKQSLFQLEALLFGQAGLLEGSFEEAYPQKLQKEYHFLQKKYRLRPLAAASWKFARLRPAAFPSIRIALFASLLHQSEHLFSKMLAAKNVKEIEHAFDLKLSNYWLTHYRFGKESVRRPKRLGKATIHLFIINAIAPVLFMYGKLKDERPYQDQALRLLEELPPERNHIILKWAELGMEVSSAHQSQALLQLKKHYCDQQGCLSCAIGSYVMQARS